VTSRAASSITVLIMIIIMVTNPGPVHLTVQTVPLAVCGVHDHHFHHDHHHNNQPWTGAPHCPSSSTCSVWRAQGCNNAGSATAGHTTLSQHATSTSAEGKVSWVPRQPAPCGLVKGAEEMDMTTRGVIVQCPSAMSGGYRAKQHMRPPAPEGTAPCA